MEILQEVRELPRESLSCYILDRASLIVSQTQGDSWDDPEEWALAAAQLAHAVWRYFKGE